MDSSELLRRLCKEKKDWKASINLGPEVHWVVRGIDVCILQVKNMLREQYAKKRLKENGFTLVELMLIVAIIGILAAIAYPQFADLTRKAWEGKTKANLGTLRSALSIYYGDQEGIYPTDNLQSLLPRYLQEIPMQDTRPYHNIGNDVGNGDSSQQVDSRNSWFYFSVWGDPMWGKVIVNCDHQDLHGEPWSTY